MGGVVTHPRRVRCPQRPPRDAQPQHARPRRPANSPSRGEILAVGNRHRDDRYRRQQTKQRCQQHPGVHEVAALPDPVERLQQAADEDEGHRRPAGFAPPGPAGRSSAPRGAAGTTAGAGCRHQQQAQRHQQHHRHPQRVGRVEVRQIDHALRPLVAGGVLGQGGAGHQQAVVAHPEDLVGDRQTARRPPRSAPDAARYAPRSAS